jgi:hypothetical protein
MGLVEMLGINNPLRAALLHCDRPLILHNKSVVGTSQRTATFSDKERRRANVEGIQASRRRVFETRE